MTLVKTAALSLIAASLLLAGFTRLAAWRIERRNPPSGTFATVNGTRMHFVREPADGADLPAIVFIHGASGNLRDQMLPLRPLLQGRAELLFLDRPGHGWSQRGPDENAGPAGQARTVAALMRHLGIGRAIVVGHSFGGAVAAALGLDHADKVAGLVFLSAATHPWPGGGTSWYYRLTAMPLIGRIFSETLSLPAGMLRLPAATAGVFAPNPVPDGYARAAAIDLVLRPSAFRANAADVEALHDHVTRAAPRYRSITVPTVVITGDRDTVVYEEIHSQGLARDIPGAELIWVRNLGHKPDWIAPELAVAAIEKLAGRERDLQAMARAIEERIAGDAFGPLERDRDEGPDLAASPAR